MQEPAKTFFYAQAQYLIVTDYSRLRIARHLDSSSFRFAHLFLNFPLFFISCDTPDSSSYTSVSKSVLLVVQ